MLSHTQDAIPAAPPLEDEEVLNKALLKPKSQTLLDELLSKTKNRKAVGEVITTTKQATASTTRTVSVLLSPKKSSKWTIESEEVKRPQTLVTLHTQTMLAQSACHASVLVSEKYQSKIQKCKTELEQIDSEFKKIVFADPVSFIKSSLQLKINRLFIVSHLIALGQKVTTVEQPKDHDARTVNRALRNVINLYANEFCDSIKRLSNLLVAALFASKLVDRTKILTQADASKAIIKYFDSLYEIIIKNDYILPSETSDGEYLSHLTKNLCHKLFDGNENALKHFKEIEFFNSSASDWVAIDKAELQGFSQKVSCAIL